MALTFAAYAAPAQWQRPVAVAAVRRADGGRTTAACTKTALLTRVIVDRRAARAGRWSSSALRSAAAPASARWPTVAGRAAWHGILQSAGLLFFAFAGYARIATLGEEVRDPARTIPRAIPLALGLAVVVYAVVAVTVLLGARGRGGSPASIAPLAARSVPAGGWRWRRRSSGSARRAAASARCSR